jgi:uncharacterized alkaline shock family protein YloU
MGMKTNKNGTISISPNAIASVAARAALTSYGIVGMASKNIMDGLANAIARDPRHGVDVTIDGDQICVDLYIIIEYSTRITSVATSVANTVQYQVEKSIGLPVVAVNVHVQDLRVSSGS